MQPRLKLKQAAAEGVLTIFQKYFSVNENVGKYSWAARSLEYYYEI